MLPKRNCEKITVYNDSGAPSTEYRHFIRQDDTASTSHNAATASKNRPIPGFGNLPTYTDNKQGDNKIPTYYLDNNHVDTDKVRQSQTNTDSRNFYGHRMDSGDTLVSNVYDSKAVQNTIGSSGTVIMDKTGDSKDIIYSNDRNYGKSGWNGHFTYEAPQKQQSPTRQSCNSPSQKGPTDTGSVLLSSRGFLDQSPSGISYRSPSPSATTSSAYYVDGNHVDTNKVRQSQTNTDSRNFYGHRMDSGDTLVSNVYDSNAVQNTIGSSGTVIMDKTGDSKDIIYSNDRNYGKSGWNGHFTYEAPQKQESPTRQSCNSPSQKGPTDTGSVLLSSRGFLDQSPSGISYRSPSPSATTSSAYYVDGNHVDTNKVRQSQTNTDSRNFYGHRMDSGDTLVSNVYDSNAVQNTIGSSGTVIMDKTGDSKDIIYSNDRNYGKSGWNGHFTYEDPQKKQLPTGQSDKYVVNNNSRGPSDQSASNFPSDHSPTRSIPEETSPTFYADENYVDTNKMRQSQNNTDSRNFYGHTVDSKNTLVGNVYDSTATQNTIGTSGKIFKDNMTDSTDVIYSNDRLYGKTGWNGKFVYEKSKPKDGLN